MALTDEARNAIAGEAWAVAEKMKPSAASLDANRAYPDDHLDALAGAGLAGLLIPPEHGGRGGDLTSLALACEAVGWASGSTGLVFLMHLCGSATIAALATPEQAEEWLVPAASGDALATLAFSERATGAHFYLPEIRAERRNGSYVLNRKKTSFKSLLKIRANFLPELFNSTDNL